MLRIALRDGGRSCAAQADLLAREEPLGIRVDGTALTLTMRTPGDDIALAAGFLVSEAVIHSPADIAAMTACDGTKCGHAGHDGLGIVDVALAAAVGVPATACRSFLTTSAYGVCGKASIDDICVLPQAAVAADSWTCGRGPSRAGRHAAGAGTRGRESAAQQPPPRRQ